MVGTDLALTNYVLYLALTVVNCHAGFKLLYVHIKSLNSSKPRNY